MPGLSGFQVAERLYTDAHPTRIALMSAGLSDGLVAAGCGIGIRGFIAKMRMHDDLLPALVHMREGRAFMPSVTAFAGAAASPQGRHALQLADSKEERLAAATAYLLTAWYMGHVLLTVAPAEDVTAVAERLTAAGLDLESAAAAGRYATVDAEAALAAVMHNGEVDAERFTTLFGPLIDQLSADYGQGPRHVSTFGELAPVLCAEGRIDAAVYIEQVANDFLVGRRLSILCTCAGTQPDGPQGDDAARLCAVHPTIIASS